MICTFYLLICSYYYFNILINIINPLFLDSKLWTIPADLTSLLLFLLLPLVLTCQAVSFISPSIIKSSNLYP